MFPYVPCRACAGAGTTLWTIDAFQERDWTLEHLEDLTELNLRRRSRQTGSGASSAIASQQTGRLESAGDMLEVLPRQLLPFGDVLEVHRALFRMKSNVKHRPGSVARSGRDLHVKYGTKSIV